MFHMNKNGNVVLASDGIRNRRLVGCQNTSQGTAGSSLNSPIRSLRLGVGGVIIGDEPVIVIKLVWNWRYS